MKYKPEVFGFFDEATNAVCYIVKDPTSNACAVIDSILDFDMSSGALETTFADKIIKEVVTRKLEVKWVLETHVHADHLSAAPYLAKQLSGKLGISSRIDEVQAVFGKVFNAGTAFETNGNQFDALFEDGDEFFIGNMPVKVIHTPGHTPACVSYCIGNAAFVGDTLFMPDFGTARTDFPGGDPRQLFNSIQRLLSLPEDTRLFLCHDYKAPGREEFCWETTVKAQREENIHVGGNKTEDEFVSFRTNRDAELALPKLIIPSIQVNMRAGELPPPENDGEHYLKIPINKMQRL
ncbi:MAG: MBL fold metallo-hydrolase [Acidiferrobacterales bacterium]|nr:MBL fold metallo-hydrolase [Acidiferrobacterales bacterium]